MSHISINKEPKRNNLAIAVRSDLFQDPKETHFNIELDYEKIAFTRCGLNDTNGHKMGIIKGNPKGRRFSMINENLKCGRFEADEDESNEDRIVFYFE